MLTPPLRGGLALTSASAQGARGPRGGPVEGELKGPVRGAGSILQSKLFWAPLFSEGDPHIIFRVARAHGPTGHLNMRADQ
jgi:hypothetical protein